MTTQTNTFVCPECNKRNLYDLAPEGDAEIDIGVVRCWYCKSEVILCDGEDSDEYRPHLEGQSKWDEFDRGNHADGRPVI